VPIHSAFAATMSWTSPGTPSIGILPGPGQHRTSALPGLDVRRSVLRQLVAGQLTQRAARQHCLDEDVVRQHELLTLRAPESAEQLRSGSVRAVPGDRCDERLEVGDPANGVRVTPGPIDREHAAPVVADQDHVVRQPEGLEERIDVPPMVDEPVSQARVRVRGA